MGLDDESQRLLKTNTVRVGDSSAICCAYGVSLDSTWSRICDGTIHDSDERGTGELRRRINEADASRKHLTPCFKCAVHICADGRDLRLNPEEDVGILGCLSNWARDCGRPYRWETACLSKVHINREPSGQVRIAMMVINKRRIKGLYDIRIGEPESELQQAMSNSDKQLFRLTRRPLTRGYKDMVGWGGQSRDSEPDGEFLILEWHLNNLRKSLTGCRVQGGKTEF